MSDNTLRTTNKWLIFGLLSAGVRVIKIEHVVNKGKVPLVQYVFECTKEAEEIRRKYDHHIPFPVDDLWRIEQFERHFKHNVTMVEDTTNEIESKTSESSSM